MKMNDALSCKCNAVGREYAVKANCNYVVVITVCFDTNSHPLTRTSHSKIVSESTIRSPFTVVEMARVYLRGMFSSRDYQICI